MYFECVMTDEIGTPIPGLVMGEGRPFFGQLSLEDVPLGTPTVCIPSDRVVHLTFPVKR